MGYLYIKTDESMNAVFNKILRLIGFLFADLIPLAIIVAGALFFIIVLPTHAILLTVIWAVVVIVIDVRYSKWY